MEDQDQDKPLIKVYFDESSGLTEEDELLVLKYLNLPYIRAGGEGLKIISDKRYIYVMFN